MLKSVIQAIPVYCMSICQFPQSLGDKIQKIMNSYWWDSCKRDLKGIKWLNWDKLCMEKLRGGMGFRNLFAFNMVMLGKQGWRLLYKPNALPGRIFKAKYYPTGDFMGSSIGHNPSYIMAKLVLFKGFVKGRL